MPSTRSQARLAAYVRDVAVRMRLGGWKIGVAVADLETEHDGAAALCEAIYGRKLATVTIDERWVDWTSEDVRHYVVHELVHCHFNAHLTLAQDLADDGLMPRRAHDAWLPGFRQAYEYAVDAMADVIAPTMPLPTLPTRKKK